MDPDNPHPLIPFTDPIPYILLNRTIDFCTRKIRGNPHHGTYLARSFGRLQANLANLYIFKRKWSLTCDRKPNLRRPVWILQGTNFFPPFTELLSIIPVAPTSLHTSHHIISFFHAYWRRRKWFWQAKFRRLRHLIWAWSFLSCASVPSLFWRNLGKSGRPAIVGFLVPPILAVAA